MKELHARAQAPVSATMADALALLRAVEDYSNWYPNGVREVSVLERDDAGQASKVRATLHVAHGPLVRDFKLTLAVSTPAPDTIRLVRVAHGRDDPEEFEVTWRVQQDGRVEIALALDANLSVPRLLPVGGVGESLASGFVAAAARALAA
jgi:hypothetical protein